MAHGFMTLSDEVLFQYKCDNFYHKEAEGAIRYDDPDLKIDWGSLTDVELILSDKDKAAPSFKECNANFIYEENI